MLGLTILYITYLEAEAIAEVGRRVELSARHVDVDASGLSVGRAPRVEALDEPAQRDEVELARARRGEIQTVVRSRSSSRRCC